jgi:uncharacterized protein YcfJ
MRFPRKEKIMANYKTVSLVLGAVLLIAATAGASIYLTKHPSAPERLSRHGERVLVTQPVQQAVPKCNDQNIAGKAVGGVGGGVLGSMVGKGNGKTAATIGGTLGGAYLGGQVIPLQNATCQ